MPVRFQHDQNQNSFYFVTFTCYKWLQVFEIANAYNSVYKWFDHLHKNNIYVTGYVIMPNHVHVLLYFHQMPKSLNTIIGNAKRFIAYEIIKRLKETNQTAILEQLQSAVTEKEKQKGQLHKVFEESFDAKSIDNRKFFLQKLNYIHLNPVRGNYKLVNDWRQYEHSSAGFYELQQTKHFIPVHFEELK